LAVLGELHVKCLIQLVHSQRHDVCRACFYHAFGHECAAHAGCNKPHQSGNVTAHLSNAGRETHPVTLRRQELMQSRRPDRVKPNKGQVSQIDQRLWQAVWAGPVQNVPATTTRPSSRARHRYATSEHARSLIRAEGAQLIVHGATGSEANDWAQTLISPMDAFVHPFNHPVMWNGHATTVEQLWRLGTPTPAQI
jgi:hypothetical protein